MSKLEQALNIVGWLHIEDRLYGARKKWLPKPCDRYS
jgi:hypothetical protein